MFFVPESFSVCCVWNVFVGGKMVDEGEGALEVLQARLMESEAMARHFESLVQERDHQLNQANRVSSRDPFYDRRKFEKSSPKRSI